MKLGIEHLSPYLPYMLQYISPEHEAQSMLDIYKPESIEVMIPTSMMSIIHRELKIVLKPMKTLTQEELIAEGFGSHIDYLTHELQNPKNKNRISSDGKPSWRVEKAPFEMVQYLIREHYDVFGLLEAGLAVDYYIIKAQYPDII